MNKTFSTLALTGFALIFSSCSNGNYGGGRGNSFKLPPGQVKKITGFNPASGKLNNSNNGNGNGKYKKNKKNKR